MKGLPPAQGRKPSHRNRWCHKDTAIFLHKNNTSLMKIGNKTYRRQHVRSPIMGIGSDVSDLTGVRPALPKWIIPDKGHQS